MMFRIAIVLILCYVGIELSEARGGGRGGGGGGRGGGGRGGGSRIGSSSRTVGGGGAWTGGGYTSSANGVLHGGLFGFTAVWFYLLANMVVRVIY